MEELPNPTQPIGISRKITSIAAGEAHTLALTGDGKVYSWGRGTFGRLGTGSEEDRHFPVRVRFSDSDEEGENQVRIVGISAGAYHSLALADNGSIWGWGYNIYGQIGVSGDNHLVPRLLECFFAGSSIQDDETKNGKLLKASSIRAGGMMSLAIDEHGSLWMWGSCPHPSQTQSPEGLFSFALSGSPLPVWNFHGHTVVKVACGNEHVISLVSAGETYKGGDLICYSWGSNSHGQLGLGDRENRLNPEVIKEFNIDSPWEIYDISCGASHTALLAKRKEETSGVLESFCWTFGLGDNGQLGHGTTQSLESPQIVQNLPSRVFLRSIDCGLFHTSVVSSGGEVWSWGMEKGRGLCPDVRFTGTDPGDSLLPLLIRKFLEPMEVVCGGAHTVLVADSGFKIWSWGRGSSGALGNGRTFDSYEPCLVLWPTLEDDFEGGGGQKKDFQEKDFEEKKDLRENSKMEIEMRALRKRLSAVEGYAGVLYGSIFGRPLRGEEIPEDFGGFDVGREWENMLESLDQRGLARLEMFYRDMRAGVKDKLLKRRVQEMVNECMSSSSASKTA